MTFLNSKNLKIASSVIGASLILCSSALGQTQQNANAPKVSGWFKTCNEVEGTKICNVQYRILAPNNANLVTLSLVEREGDEKGRFFRIVLPTGRSLPQGVQLQVDEKKASAIPYLFCIPQGCTAQVGLNDELVDVFKKSGKLNVVTVDFQLKVQNYPVTLKGFTKAYDGEPIKVPTAEDRQKQLQEQLKNKIQKEN